LNAAERAATILTLTFTAANGYPYKQEQGFFNQSVNRKYKHAISRTSDFDFSTAAAYGCA